MARKIRTKVTFSPNTYPNAHTADIKYTIYRKGWFGWVLVDVTYNRKTALDFAEEISNVETIVACLDQYKIRVVKRYNTALSAFVYSVQTRYFIPVWVESTSFKEEQFALSYMNFCVEKSLTQHESIRGEVVCASFPKK